MEIDAYDEGVPSWVDLGTSDIAAGAAFYAGLFGWDVPEGPPDAGGYRIATLRGRPVAGIGGQQNPGPPYWTTYVNTSDAEAAADRVGSSGGTVIVPPFDVLDAGRMAVFLDPAGAAFSVWQPGNHHGAGIVNEPGSLSWNELVTTDIDGSKEFYGEVFGWRGETYGEGPGAYTEFKLGDRSVAGMMAKPEAMPAEVPPYWGVYFAVDDCDASAARVTELGGAVIAPPMDIEPGRFAVVSDPQGAMFQVMKLKPDLG